MGIFIVEGQTPFKKAYLQIDPIIFVRLGLKETRYVLGQEPPRYQLPAVINSASIDEGMVYISAVDEWHRCAPVITWYNEAWGIPLPSDHGVADYSRRDDTGKSASRLQSADSGIEGGLMCPRTRDSQLTDAITAAQKAVMKFPYFTEREALEIAKAVVAAALQRS